MFNVDNLIYKKEHNDTFAVMNSVEVLINSVEETLKTCSELQELIDLKCAIVKSDMIGETIQHMYGNTLKETIPSFSEYDSDQVPKELEPYVREGNRQLTKKVCDVITDTIKVLKMVIHTKIPTCDGTITVPIISQLINEKHPLEQHLKILIGDKSNNTDIVSIINKFKLGIENTSDLLTLVELKHPTEDYCTSSLEILDGSIVDQYINVCKQTHSGLLFAINSLCDYPLVDYKYMTPSIGEELAMYCKTLVWRITTFVNTHNKILTYRN